MSVCCTQGSPLRAYRSVDILYEVADILVTLVHAHTDDGCCINGFGCLKHLNEPKAMGSIRIKTTTEGNSAFVYRSTHQFPTIEIGVRTNVYHRAIIAEGGDALLLQCISEFSLNRPSTFNASPCARLQEGKSEVNGAGSFE